MIKRLLILLSMTAYNIYAADAEYKTSEFKDGKSNIAMMYTCAVIGEKDGFDADALPIVAKSSSKMGIPAKKAGELMSDALTWWEANHDKYDIASMWKASCKEPLSNMRKMYANQ